MAVNQFEQLLKLSSFDDKICRLKLLEIQTDPNLKELRNLMDLIYRRSSLPVEEIKTNFSIRQQEILGIKLWTWSSGESRTETERHLLDEANYERKLRAYLVIMFECLNFNTKIVTIISLRYAQRSWRGIAHWIVSFDHESLKCSNPQKGVLIKSSLSRIHNLLSALLGFLSFVTNRPASSIGRN